MKPHANGSSSSPRSVCSIHPQGWVPIETPHAIIVITDGYTPCSIHPQGWVPIETIEHMVQLPALDEVAFTPKGGCPLKHNPSCAPYCKQYTVAFTPKGGCPLKQHRQSNAQTILERSIHPQGWVPIETRHLSLPATLPPYRSIHPQGWVPIETSDSLLLPPRG